MFYEFTHRHTPCYVDNQHDLVILSRENKATTVAGKEYVYNGMFSPVSKVHQGSLVETIDSFLVQTMRSTTDKDKYCSLIKTNAVIEVQRYTQIYDKHDNPLKASFDSVEKDIKANVQYVTAQLRQNDAGLLPTTVYVLQIQSTVDVKRPSDRALVLPDRIIINERPYQVDVVDDLKFPNLYHVQLSEDKR
ncbi:hypothetical protein BVG16_13495 [Paenibacillus selenitireducens]|uniref:Uncharacterized protein n=1 Tax=Paenibacillus selenitireducens TaxID=1324314 RepID=A0A1T2XC36_9BACL|nr:hypothetical protein [Paenibacillus selenitireducens]OPA77464.1 hypothetical protein BVG16_13495 [Paenibacillus selenitireducens]